MKGRDIEVGGRRHGHTKISILNVLLGDGVVKEKEVIVLFRWSYWMYLIK